MSKTPAPATLQEKFDLFEAALNEEIMERRAEIRATAMALIARVPIFLYGPPGIAKSLLVTRTADYISGVGAFEILMTRFTQPEEVFGPVSLKGLEEDRFERRIDGYLPTAQLAFIDEIFKANSSILNALLWAINERKYRHDSNIIDIPLDTLFCASNELPQDEALGALYDRLLFRFDVKPVRDQSNFLRMLKKVREENPVPILTYAEVQQAQEEAKLVTVGDDVLEATAELRKQLKAEGIEPTERRFVNAMKVVRAAAWLDSCTVADVEHLRPLQHILWDRPEQAAQVDKIVLAIANPLDNEAADLLTGLDKLEEQLNALANDEDKHRKGTEIHGKLRRAKKELDELMKRAGTGRRRSVVVEEVRSKMHNLTSRVLVEVFNMDPDEITPDS